MSVRLFITLCFCTLRVPFYIIVKIFPTHLALSGTNQGVAIAKAKGTLVPIANVRQSSAHNANHGSNEAASVKNRAMDMFATNVRHFGPTYSRTVMKII